METSQFIRVTIRAALARRRLDYRGSEKTRLIVSTPSVTFDEAELANRA
jgi:hypothetical protein